ncbi:MAG: BON domain-containing protein [Gammaproteobacteria bacterium]|nr:BON domain-containing protein [Gammaproteobacteria bacterium]
MKKIISLIFISLTLQSCIFAVGTAAGAAAVAAVYDHRKVEQVMKDQKIANNAIDAINAIPGIRNNDNHINVTTFNQVILLTGQVSTPELKQQVEEAAKASGDSKQVYNQLTVRGPISTLTRGSDAWITAKIKTEMLTMKDLKSSSIKVVTENGAVYLMGIVNHEQAENAVDIAREVAGVQKVVRVFQYEDNT